MYDGELPQNSSTGEPLQVGDWIEPLSLQVQVEVLEGADSAVVDSMATLDGGEEEDLHCWSSWQPIGYREPNYSERVDVCTLSILADPAMGDTVQRLAMSAVHPYRLTYRPRLHTTASVIIRRRPGFIRDRPPRYRCPPAQGLARHSRRIIKRHCAIWLSRTAREAIRSSSMYGQLLLVHGESQETGPAR